MSDTLPISAANTVLSVGDGADPEEFTPVAEVQSISGPAIKVDVKEANSMSSGLWKRRIPTLIDAGDVSFDLNFLPGDESHTSLYDKLKTRALTNFRVELPTTPEYTWAFSGYVTSFEQDAPLDGFLTAKVTITLNGEPTLTAAA